MATKKVLVEINVEQKGSSISKTTKEIENLTEVEKERARVKKEIEKIDAKIAVANEEETKALKEKKKALKDLQNAEGIALKQEKEQIELLKKEEISRKETIKATLKQADAVYSFQKRMEAQKNAELKSLSVKDDLTIATEKLANEQKQEAIEIAKVNYQIQQQQKANKLFAKEQVDLADAVENTTGKMQEMKTTAGLSGAIVTEFGRTISDAPYGLRGMGNNLSQLASLFGVFAVNVKKSGRSVKAGLKEIALSFVGPIGIITVLQVVIALAESGKLAEMWDWVSGANKSVKELTNRLAELKEELVGTVGSFNAMTASLRDGRIPAEQRLQLITEMLEVFPEATEVADAYTESINNNNSTVETANELAKEFSRNLLDRAINQQKLKEAQEKAVEIAEKRLLLEKQIEAENDGFDSSEVEKQIIIRIKQFENIEKLNKEFGLYKEKLKEVRSVKEAKKLTDELTESVDYLASSSSQANLLNSVIKQYASNATKGVDEIEKLTKEFDKLSESAANALKETPQEIAERLRLLNVQLFKEENETLIAINDAKLYYEKKNTEKRAELLRDNFRLKKEILDNELIETKKSIEKEFISRKEKDAKILIAQNDFNQKYIKLQLKRDEITSGSKSKDRVVKQFKERELSFAKEQERANQNLINTQSRTNIEILKQEGEFSKKSIQIKRDEFIDKEKIRLKDYVDQQKINKELKGISASEVKDIEKAIKLAEEKSAKTIESETAEAQVVIDTIEKVTQARIKNREKLDELSQQKRDDKVEEGFASTLSSFMAEGMAKVNAEAELDQLKYDNKVAAADAEILLLTTTEDRKREIETEKQLWEQEKRATDLQNEIDVINERRRVQEQYIGFIGQTAGILQAIGNKNKEWQKTQLILEKGVAIAGVVTEAASSISKQLAADGAAKGLETVAAAGMNAVTLGTTGNAYLPAKKGEISAATAKNIAKTKLGAGLSIAAITSGAISGLSSISNSGGGSSSGGGGNTTVQPPDFNIVGSTGVNQLADAIGSTEQQPVKAYVVANDVTTQQALDRNNRSNAEL